MTSLDLRCVFDTNLLISALLFEHSKPDRALRYILIRGVLLFSVDLLAELQNVLSRKKFDGSIPIWFIDLFVC